MLGSTVASLYSAFDELHRMPPHQAMQRVIYWGVMILAVLLVVLSTWYQGRVADRVTADVQTIVAALPWAKPLVSSEGREVYLRGEVEPSRDIRKLVASLAALPSVRTVSEQLDQKPLPTADFRLSRSDGSIELEGTLNGDDLDRAVQAVKRAFPNAGIRDRIRIDDRVGSPFWIDSALPALQTLQPMETFNLYGWRDVVMVNGIADSNSQRDRLRYALAARLGNQVRVDYQVRLATDQDKASISLVSGWNGASLRGQIPDPKTGKQLLRALVALADVDSEEAVTSDLVYNTSLASPRLIRQTAQFLPALSRVHDLRLETSGDGITLWGRVDSSEQLGQVVAAIDKANLVDSIDNRLFVDPAVRLPEISLFRDSTRAIVSGRMPGIRARANLLATLKDQLGVSRIESFVSVEPNIFFSPWLDQWSTLLTAIPESAFGLTVADDGVIVSGEVATRQNHETLVARLERLFPDSRIINWMTIADD